MCPSRSKSDVPAVLNRSYINTGSDSVRRFKVKIYISVSRKRAE